jgi:hypothetical protein
MFMSIQKNAGYAASSTESNLTASARSSMSESPVARSMWLARIVRELRYRLRIVLSAPSSAKAELAEKERVQSERNRLAEEYSEGYLAGWHECYAACLDAVEDELSNKCEIWAAGALLTGPESLQKTN